MIKLTKIYTKTLITENGDSAHAESVNLTNFLDTN